MAPYRTFAITFRAKAWYFPACDVPVIETTIYQEYEKVGIILNAPILKCNLKKQIMVTRNNLYRLDIATGNDAFCDCISNAHYPRNV